MLWLYSLGFFPVWPYDLLPSGRSLLTAEGLEPEGVFTPGLSGGLVPRGLELSPFPFWPEGFTVPEEPVGLLPLPVLPTLEVLVELAAEEEGLLSLLEEGFLPLSDEGLVSGRALISGAVLFVSPVGLETVDAPLRLLLVVLPVLELLPERCEEEVVLLERLLFCPDTVTGYAHIRTKLRTSATCITFFMATEF